LLNVHRRFLRLVQGERLSYGAVTVNR
jgi:hypothetical protein